MKEQKSETRSQETITISRAEYEELKGQNEWLMEQLRLANKRRFGASSEQTAKQLDGQLSLTFNEAEAYAAAPGPKRVTQVAAHTRKQSGSAKDAVPEDIPVEVVEHRLSDEERTCPQCGEEMREIGTEVRETLVLIPAKAVLRRDVYYTYACESCEKNDISTPIAKAPREPAVIPGSFASPEAIAYIMAQKFVMASPLYRQEQEWGRQGLKLSRQTMSNWVLRAAEDWLRPVYAVLRRRLVLREILHADETTLQVLREPGKKAQSLFKISPRMSWRRIFRPDCVKNPCHPSGCLRIFALQGKKSTRQSIHVEILNRLSDQELYVAVPHQWGRRSAHRTL